MCTHTGSSTKLDNFLTCSELCLQCDNKSVTEFCTPGICEKLKSMLNIAAMSHEFLAHIANVVSLALPIFKTSTTTMLSQKICIFFSAQ